MKWFDKWFNNKVRQSWEQAKEAKNMTLVSPSVDRSLGDHRSSMNVQIHSASGGYILEFTKYDRKRDEHNRNLHIVTEEQNLGEAISQIITVEMLRN